MKIKIFKSIITIAVAAAISISHFNFLTVSAASDNIVINVELINPIEYTSADEKATEEEYAPAMNALKNITQSAYDAFVMDQPLKSMWMDINNSNINISTRGIKTGNHFLWTITNITNNIKTLESYSSPHKPDYLTERLSYILTEFTPDGNSLSERIRSIHDYICYRAEYTKYNKQNAPYVYSAYGALIDRHSVCEGYAEAFKLLCDMNGIECILVSGLEITTSKKENHMWNYVKMDDGKWYAVDVTWDDGKKISDSYLLVGSKSIVNKYNGTVFSANHIPSGDISSTGLKQFKLPELSEKSYFDNNKSRSDYIQASDDNFDVQPYQVGAAEKDKKSGNFLSSFYYNQLNDEQKNFYNSLLNVTPPGDGETFVPETGTEIETTKPDTTKPDTTKPDTTKPDITKPDTTKPDTVKPDTTNPDATDSDITSDNNTSASDHPFGSDTTDKTEINDSMTITISGRTEEDTDSQNTHENKHVNFSRIIRIIVIVTAILALFIYIIFIIIRFANKEKDDKK